MIQPSSENLKATMRNHGICVIIPTYNNAGTLRQVVSDVLKYSCDVIVVNDGSTDDTKKILTDFRDRIDIVSYPDNKGKGGALKAGFCRAIDRGFSYAITIDSDGQHFADDIPDFVAAIVENPGALIIGQRNLTNVDINGKSSFANKFSNFWFHLQTGKNLKDTQTGYRAYPLKNLHGLSLLTSRYEAELELLVFAAWHGVRIISIPIRVYYPPQAERISHFKPALDFTRISILNTFLCIGAIVYGVPAMFINALRKRRIFTGEFKFFTHRNKQPKEASTTLGRLAKSVYGGIAFVILSIGVYTPLSLIYFSIGKNTDRKKLRFHKKLQWVARFFTNNFPDAKVEFRNIDNDTFSKPSLIVCNHQSHLDLPMLMSMNPKLVFLTNDWVWNNFFIGNIVHKAEYLPVSAGIDTLLPKLEELRDRGYSVVVFPEGTRSADCSILRFHQGAFYLADRLGIDILPMVLHGVGHYLPKNDVMFRSGVITLECLDRVPYAELQNMGALRAQASYFRKIISRRYSMIAHERETPAYFKDLVYYKYAYRGWNTVARCKNILKRLSELECYITDVYAKAQAAYFINSGIGVIPLLCALSNRDVDVYAFEENIDLFNVAVSTPALPPNLHFIHTVWHDDYNAIPTDNAEIFVIGTTDDITQFQKFSPTLIPVES